MSGIGTGDDKLRRVVTRSRIRIKRRRRGVTGHGSWLDRKGHEETSQKLGKLLRMRLFTCIKGKQDRDFLRRGNGFDKLGATGHEEIDKVFICDHCIGVGCEGGDVLG